MSTEDSGFSAGESLDVGEPAGAQDQAGSDAHSAGEGHLEEVSSSMDTGAEPFSGVEASPIERSSRPAAAVHSVSNPLPELEMVSQRTVQEGSTPVALKREVAPSVRLSIPRPDHAVQDQGAGRISNAQPISSLGLSSEVLVVPESSTPEKTSGPVARVADARVVQAGVDGPRAEVVNSTGQAQKPTAVVEPQVSGASPVSAPTAHVADLPAMDRTVERDVVRAKMSGHSGRPQVEAASRTPASPEDHSRLSGAPQAPAEQESLNTASPSREPAIPARETGAEPVRPAHQAAVPSQVKGGATSQGLNVTGGLAEVTNGGGADEVPASVNLTRRALRSLGRGHGGATVVQLRPAQFGKVTVRVQMEDGRVQADLVARTPEAARVLGEHLQMLRDSLEHKGLVVDRLEVREESKIETSRLDQPNEKDTDEDRSGDGHHRRDDDAASDQSSRTRGESGDRSDEFGQILMATEEQA